MTGKKKQKQEQEQKQELCENKPAGVQKEKSKLDILKEVVANEKKREAEKQKQIYNAMADFIYERKG